MDRYSFIHLLFFAPFARGQSSVSTKLQEIDTGQSKPGSMIVFAKGEIDEYVRLELRKHQVKGLRSPNLVLGTGRAGGTAKVDFSLLQQQRTGRPPGMLSRLLLSGERDLEVDLRISSAPRYSRIDILSVMVDGFEVSGAALDWMIDNYVRPRYASVKIGEWFLLRDNISTVEVTPFDVRVKMVG